MTDLYPKTHASGGLGIYIEPSQLGGAITIPPSKSHTLRAILFAALAEGHSHIKNPLHSPDTLAMIQAVRALGAQVEAKENSLIIRGVAGHPHVADDVIQCGNSGQVLRFIGAVAGLIPHYTLLTGDFSIRHYRPVKPLLDGLQQLGALALSSRGEDRAPLLIKGPFTHDKACVEGADSQPISGLLIAAACAPFPIELVVTNPGEKPWIDLTLDWFQRLGIPYQTKAHTYYRMQGFSPIASFSYTVPGDWSSAAFPIIAALITQSELTLHNVDSEEIQGDKIILSLVQKMGARLIINPQAKTISLLRSPRLKGIRIDGNDCIDALPILAVLGCVAEGTTEIFNVAMARNKESDRIAAIVGELKKMGAQIEAQASSILVHSSVLQGGTLDSHKDHRIALSLAVAALAAQTPSILMDTACITKSYPRFVADFCALGALIREVEP